ncbi:MAG: hypothetical protein U5K56_04175 [Halioglobus sp.]|nr:hypothetical protein [Halioglobus sp.]
MRTEYARRFGLCELTRPLFQLACHSVFLLCAGMGLAQSALADGVSIEGLEWRQLTDTAGAGLTWQDVASVCPLDETPCQGSVRGVDFTGWTWASPERVNDLIDALIGLPIPTNTAFDSPTALFYDRFDAVLGSASVQLSYGLTAQSPAGDTVEILKIRDARTNSGSDELGRETITVTDSESTGGFFGPQPIGVFLVRDPDLELCGNGIDDDGDGDTDTADDDCPAANPVVNGLEWRQPNATNGFSYLDVVSVCTDQDEPCDGSLGGVDFTGWTWASFAQLQAMLQTVTGRTIPVTLPYDDNFVAPFFGLFNLNTKWDDPSSSRRLAAYANDDIGEVPRDSFRRDPATCVNGLDDDDDGDVDLADTNCHGVRYNLITDALVPDLADRLQRVSFNPTSESDGFIGFFLVREPVPPPTAEVCDNTLDDDGDGLIDDADIEDCRETDFVGLRVACMHDPLYVAESGEVVTIRAEALDRQGRPVDADAVKIFLGFDRSVPQASAEIASSVMLEFPRR